jgi:alpha-tubulin suppressor-like RCC1 family protein
VHSITAGGAHSCAVMRDGTVKCWGFSPHGQLGQSSTETIGDNPGEMPPIATRIFD